MKSWISFKNKSSKELFNDDILITDINIEQPKLKTYTVDVPYANGVLDFSLTNGAVYENRTITIKIYLEGENKTDLRNIQYSKLSMWLTSNKLEKLFVSTIENYYFLGKVMSITIDKEYFKSAEITITFEVEPYKYAIRNEIIEKTVYNGDTILLPNLNMPTSPVVTSSVPITLIFNDKNIQYPKGTYKNYDLTLSAGYNKVVVNLAAGLTSANIKIEYKKGVL